MSGHSKWATIHRQKEVKDAKKGAVFTKMAAAIAMAVREGGRIADPDKNFKLRLAVEKARQSNMPKENISRAIDKGMGVGEEGNMEEVMFEGFLPAGCCVMAMAITDNKNRTSQQVRSFLEKHGASLAGQGAVGYLFKPLGEIKIQTKEQSGQTREEQELELIDLGAEDFEEDGEELMVYCHKEKTPEIRGRLESSGYTVTGMDLILRPDSWVEVKDEETKNKIEQILEQLEDLEDITHVFTNYQPV